MGVTLNLKYSQKPWMRLCSEAVVQECSVKKVFLEISQNWQENISARVSIQTGTQMFSCEFCEISKNPFFHSDTAPPLVAAPGRWL